MIKKFENIFSTTKTSNKENVCPNPNTPIIIDTREKQSLISSILINKKANIKLEKLEIADYLIEGKETIAIERKTFSDFISSMINKRLQTQLIELKKYPKYFLVVEGFYYNYKNEKIKIHENAIRGMLLSIVLDFQVPIIFTENEEDTAKFLIVLAKRQTKPKTEIGLRQMKTLSSVKEQKQFILEGFPGIGPTIAKKMLEEFSCLNEIFNSSKEQLRLVENFSEDKIEKFKELLEDKK